MNKILFKIKILLLLVSVAILLICSNSFAAKYTIASGKDFNTRIKMSINKSYNSATPEFTLTAFKYSPTLNGPAIDISEDGDSSVLAYIKNNIIYCVSDDDIYLNEDASYMFDKFVDLKQVDLSFLDFSKTKKTKFMFGNCKYLKDINFDGETNFKLNEMDGMFFDCQSIVNLNLFMFDTKNVKSMNSLFFNCKNLKNIYVDPNLWQVKNVTNFNKTYYNCALLKTNLNTLATSIDESKYKTFSIAGDEDKEGLLKDIDYDYDDYGERLGTFAVDKISETLVVTPDNKNTTNNISKSEIENSYNKSIVNISSTSELYEHSSNAKIGKDGKLRLSNSLIAQTLDEVPILKEETTFVDKLIPKNKNINSNSDFDKIVGEEVSTKSDVKGILRPDYSTFENVIESENTTSENIIEEETFSKEPKIDKPIFISDISIAIIFVLFIFIIAIGAFAYYFKNKQGSDEPWS